MVIFAVVARRRLAGLPVCLSRRHRAQKQLGRRLSHVLERDRLGLLGNAGLLLLLSGLQGVDVFEFELGGSECFFASFGKAHIDRPPHDNGDAVRSSGSHLQPRFGAFLFIMERSKSDKKEPRYEGGTLSKVTRTVKADRGHKASEKISTRYAAENSPHQRVIIAMAGSSC